MFDGLSELLAGWRTVAHISEWTGLSIGALAAIAAVVFYDPRVLKPAIGAAVLVGGVYAGVLYGDHVGRADVEAQWADARQAAIAAEQERGRMVEQQLAAKYSPRLDELTRQAADNKRKADDYERKLLAAMAAGAGGKAGACELGDAAERVRPDRQAGELRKGRWKARDRPAGRV